MSATSDTACYLRGYSMHDGVQDLSLMYGFSTYGYYVGNNSQPSQDQPTTDPAGDNPTGIGIQVSPEVLVAAQAAREAARIPALPTPSESEICCPAAVITSPLGPMIKAAMFPRDQMKLPPIYCEI